MRAIKTERKVLNGHSVLVATDGTRKNSIRYNWDDFSGSDECRHWDIAYRLSQKIGLEANRVHAIAAFGTKYGSNIYFHIFIPAPVLQ